MAALVDFGEFRAPLEARRHRSNAYLDRAAKRTLTLDFSQLRARQARHDLTWVREVLPDAVDWGVDAKRFRERDRHWES